jgi:predicted MFS family arabinose efflux permease
MSQSSYPSRALLLLTLIMVFNYVDRVALGIMLPDIKQDLGLSDTDLGLLTGIAFAAFYATMGIPIGRLADRGDRVRIIVATTAIWSVAVAVSGLARSFGQLLLIRVGVAIGEAGCHPPAMSLLSDIYSRDERPKAIARYMLGWPLALLLGFFVGGWLTQYHGWRVTFLILGLPGLFLALTAMALLREPRRLPAGGAGKIETPPGPKLSLPASLVALARNTGYRHLLIANAISYFFGNGILQWQPTYFTRAFGLSLGEIGTLFALIYGLGGLIGNWAGGELAARAARGDERRQLRGAALIYLVLCPIGAGVYLSHDVGAAIALLTVWSLGSAMVVGPLFAATQTFVSAGMRAVAIATMLFFCNLIGLGLGPLAAGALSDLLRPGFGEESLRYALLALCPGGLWCAWHLWRAAQTAHLPDDEAPQTNAIPSTN